MGREVRTSFGAHKYAHQSGFTLIEMIVVIVVVAILAALVVDGSRSYIVRSEDSTRSTNAQAISQKLELYYRTNPLTTGNTYPPSTTTFSALRSIIRDDSIIGAPGISMPTIVIATTGWKASDAGKGYLYVAQNANGSICSTGPCARYSIYFYNTMRKQYLSINSLRQQ